MYLVDDVLTRIGPVDRVLDVGGWACPFNRANSVLDRGPFETRGFYKTIGLPASQGPDLEHFTNETWVVRDICERTPWPFADKSFDFAICSHTLEDIRDPLFVCAELNRVAKRGYIETPSRLAETCRGWESPSIAGLSHHRWLVEYGQGQIEFTPKYHMIHGDSRHNLPPSLYYGITPEERVSWMFWEGSFEFEEGINLGLENQSRFLTSFVEKIAASEQYRELAHEPPPLTLEQTASLTRDLAETRLRLDAAHGELAGYQQLGPIALGLARRLRQTSTRHPRISGVVKPLLRLARSWVR